MGGARDGRLYFKPSERNAALGIIKMISFSKMEKGAEDGVMVLRAGVI
jgi:hypothetical protein